MGQLNSEEAPGSSVGDSVGSARLESAKAVWARLATTRGDGRLGVSAFDRAAIGVMLDYYHATHRASQDDYAVLKCESEHRLRLHAPDGRRTKFQLAGKIDKQVMRRGELGIIIVDHKTTASDLSDDGFYWRQLLTDTQGVHYQLLLSDLSDPVIDVIWDVARKCTLKPKPRETVVKFEDRVRDWYAALKSPGFVRRSQMRLSSELEEYYTDLYLETRDILHARRQGFWRKNPQACMSYGRPCPYLGICAGMDSPDDASWQKGQRHAELADNKQGDLITHSRMSCFRLCARRHLFKYELGIRREHDDDSDALRYGSAWHELMDAYWMGGSSD